MADGIINSGCHVEQSQLVVLQEELSSLLRLLLAFLHDLHTLVLQLSDLLGELKTELVVDLMTILVHGFPNLLDHLFLVLLEQLTYVLCNGVLLVHWGRVLLSCILDVVMIEDIYHRRENSWTSSRTLPFSSSLTGSGSRQS